MEVQIQGQNVTYQQAAQCENLQLSGLYTRIYPVIKWLKLVW